MTRRFLTTGASFALAAALASNALAQTGQPTTGNSADSAKTATQQSAVASPPGVPQDIIVTAQKRAQRLSEVGMAITAASGDALVRRGVTDVSGLTKFEPSLQVSQGNTGTPIYTIRGVGYFDQSLAASPTVSVYQDEVAYSYSSLTKGALLDIAQVEILKGPQGTLYGQNATGGAINFIAAKPTDHFALGVDGSIERFGRTQLSGFVSGPLTSTITARLAASVDEGGAWQKSNTRDDTLGNRNLKIGRLILDWQPASDLTVSLNVNGWTDDSDRQANQLEGFRFLSPQYLIGGPQYPAAPTNPALYLPSQPYSQYPEHIQQVLANSISPANDRAADWVAGTRPQNHERYFQPTLRLDYSASAAFGVTSLTTYENYHENDRHDDSAVNVASEGGVLIGSVKTFSQELRLHGVILDRKLNWLIGANFDKTKTSEDNKEDEFSVSPSYLTGGSPFSVLPSPPFGPFDNYEGEATTNSRTISVFGNLEYKILDNLSVHGGVRYTSSHQKFSSCDIVDDPGWRVFVAALQSELRGGAPVTPVAPGQCTIFLPDNSLGRVYTKLDQNNVPWRAGIDWKFSPNDLLYVSVSKGFKAGASPTLGGQNYIQFRPVSQEKLLSYEVGIKASFFDRAMQVQASVFHYDYTDKQVLGRIIDPTGVFGAIQSLVNIPKSTENGVELSAEVRPVTGVTLNGAATYLDSKVSRSFLNYASYATGPSDVVDFKGEPFPFTPKWSLVYGARYDWKVTDRLSAFVSVSGSYQTKTTAAFGAAKAASEGPPLDLKAYGIVDASVGVGAPDNRWRLELFGKNIFNSYYWTSAFYTNDTTVRAAGLPATYGLRVRYRF
jgi:iron complex outermembrane receptor protein